MEINEITECILFLGKPFIEYTMCSKREIANLPFMKICNEQQIHKYLICLNDMHNAFDATEHIFILLICMILAGNGWAGV